MAKRNKPRTFTIKLDELSTARLMTSRRITHAVVARSRHGFDDVLSWHAGETAANRAKQWFGRRDQHWTNVRVLPVTEAPQ